MCTCTHTHTRVYMQLLPGNGLGGLITGAINQTSTGTMQQYFALSHIIQSKPRWLSMKNASPLGESDIV